MEKVVGKPLAEKPDFSSVLRCRWGAGRRFEPVLVLAVLLQVCFLRPAGSLALLLCFSVRFVLGLELAAVPCQMLYRTV